MHLTVQINNKNARYMYKYKDYIHKFGTSLPVLYSNRLQNNETLFRQPCANELSTFETVKHTNWYFDNPIIPFHLQNLQGRVEN